MTTAEPLREPLHQYSCTVPADAPPRMEQQERMQLRAAAFRATRVFPGPVGELVSKELLSWEEHGWRIGGHGLIRRLVKAVTDAELPVPDPAVVAA